MKKISSIEVDYLSKTIEQSLQTINNFLKLNLDKTTVLRPGQRKIITGVLVNETLNDTKKILSEIRLENLLSTKIWSFKPYRGL